MGGGLAAGLLLGCAPAAYAQEPGAQREVGVTIGRIETLYLDDVFIPAERDWVELQFRALTSRGATLTDLGRRDVQVWEDDQPVPVERMSLEALDRAGSGVAVVIALDASLTMAGEPFDRAKQAALAFLDRLQPQDHVAVLSIARDAQLAAGFELSRDQTRDAVRGLRIERERGQRTVLFDGLLEAVAQIRSSALDLPRRRVVVLFSDGEDDGSRATADAAIGSALGGARARELPVRIYSVGYLRADGGGDRAVLRALAEQTGGQYLEGQTDQLEALFDFVASQIMSSYVLRFDTELDGEFHRIQLAVQDRSAQTDVLYPDRRPPIWPWLLAAGAAGALVLVAVLLLLRRRRVGRLTVTAGAKTGTVYELHAGRNRIGALDDNDIVLASSRVSRYHAEIIARGRRTRICDLRSTNGTTLNGQIVQESTLRPGDRIGIADVEIVFQR